MNVRYATRVAIYVPDPTKVTVLRDDLEIINASLLEKNRRGYAVRAASHHEKLYLYNPIHWRTFLLVNARYYHHAHAPAVQTNDFSRPIGERETIMNVLNILLIQISSGMLTKISEPSTLTS